MDAFEALFSPLSLLFCLFVCLFPYHSDPLVHLLWIMSVQYVCAGEILDSSFASVLTECVNTDTHSKHTLAAISAPVIRSTPIYSVVVFK